MNCLDDYLVADGEEQEHNIGSHEIQRDRCSITAALVAHDASSQLPDPVFVCVDMDRACNGDRDSGTLPPFLSPSY